MESHGPRDSPLSVTIVEAVAEAAGLDPTELDVPLYDVVDPDALERLFVNSSADASISFEYAGYTVTVFSDRSVDVTRG